MAEKKEVVGREAERKTKRYIQLERMTLIKWEKNTQRKMNILFLQHQ
jgi:hypothetical protein